MRGRQLEDVKQTSSESPVALSEPLVVLVDRWTGSAAEITAGALQDHDRAAIIGQTTYGKGVAQNIESMPNGYTLKVTTQKWYTPSGRSVQRERTLLQNGEYNRSAPPSLAQTTAWKRAHPTPRAILDALYTGGVEDSPRSCSARHYGGGGRSILDRRQIRVWRMQSILSSYAGSLTVHTPAGARCSAMRAALLRLRVAGFVFPRTVTTSSGPFLDRLIAERVAFSKGDIQEAKQQIAGVEQRCTTHWLCRC